MAEHSRIDRARDLTAYWLCNLIMHMVATRWYRRGIGTLMKLGLTRAEQLKKETDRG